MNPDKSKKARRPKRRGKKPDPKPARKAPAKGPLSIACSVHKVAAGEICSKTGSACRDRRRVYREGSKASTATSKPAAIPRQMKAAPKKDPIVHEPPASAREIPPKVPRVTKETAQTQEIARRIARAGDPADPTELTVCPHCNEPLLMSRYGGRRCRNSGCDLWNEDLRLTLVSRDGCNCDSCLAARQREAGEIEAHQVTQPVEQDA